MLRAHIEVALMTHGVPYDALERASENQVLRWFALVSEATEAENRRIDDIALMQGAVE